MARRALSPAQLRVAQAVAAMFPPDGPTASVVAGEGAMVLRAGVSGGADSMALAAALAHWRRRRPGLRVEALVVDHGLFPASAEHTARVVQRVRDVGLPATGVRVQVEPGGSPEDAARRARHEALWSHPLVEDPDGRPDEVWLAHTLDDQAETVLLGLARGSGVRSLAGMAARREHRTPHGTGQVVRPLLDLRRGDTEQACRDAGLEVWHDPANADPRFRRSAVRAALPGLAAALGVDPAVGLARSAELARADADLLDDLAAAASLRVRVPAANGVLLDITVLAAEPEALRGRVVLAWLRDSGCTGATQDAVARVLALVDDWHGQGPLHLPGGLLVRRRDGMLVASRT